MCALTLTVLSPFPPNLPAGTGELAIPAAVPADAPTAGAATIDLLGITGLHGHISRTTQMDSGTGQTSAKDPGAVTLAYEVSSAHAADPNTLFVSAGDSVGRSAYASSVLQDRPTMEVLNAMSLDVSTPGNHKLDQGLTDLEARVPPALSFPILAANVSDSTPLSVENGGEGAFIREVGGMHVGFAGVVVDELPTLVLPSALSALTLSPAVAATSTRAAELEDGDPVNSEADVIVVLSHGGAISTVASFSKNVSAVFSGHTHVSFAKTVTGTEDNQVAVAQTDYYGWALGCTRPSCDPTSRKTSAVSANNKDLCSSSCTTDTYGVTGIVSQAEKDSIAEGGKPLAEIGSDFLRDSDGSGPGTNRGTESTASSLIAESLRSWLVTGVQPTGSTRYVDIMNPSGVRTDLLYAVSGSEGDGVLTSGGAYTVQPLSNEMAYTTLTGAEFKTLLFQQWQPGSSRPVLILGLSRDVDVLTKATTDPGHGGGVGAAPAIREILVDGKPLADGDSIVVASNSFLLTDDDGYTVLRGKSVTNTGVLDCDVTSAYLASFGDEPVTVNCSKRQTAMTVGPAYIGSGDARSTDMVSMTLNSLAYTDPTERVAGARRMRVSAGDKKILIKDLDLTVSPTGPTTGRVDFNLTFPADTPTRTYRTVQAATCRWALVEALDAAGTVLNRFPVEIKDEDAVDPGTDSGDGAVTGADAAADGAGGRATSTPQSNPGAGETSVGGGTEPSAGSSARPAVTITPTASEAPVQTAGPERPSQAASGGPPALIGASFSVGVFAPVLLVVDGCLTLRRRQQIA